MAPVPDDGAVKQGGLFRLLLALLLLNRLLPLQRNVVHGRPRAALFRYRKLVVFISKIAPASGRRNGLRGGCHSPATPRLFAVVRCIPHLGHKRRGGGWFR